MLKDDDELIEDSVSKDEDPLLVDVELKLDPDDTSDDDPNEDPTNIIASPSS